VGAVLILRLAALAEVVAGLRQAQRRAARARPTLTAAQQLHTVRRAPPARLRAPLRARQLAPGEHGAGQRKRTVPLEQLIQGRYELARQCGINVNDEHGELRPGMDQATACIVTAPV
jgi:hypothetical protein